MYHPLRIFLYSFLCLCILTGCRGSSVRHGDDLLPQADVSLIMSDSARISPEYACCFRVTYLDQGIRLVDISTELDEGDGQAAATAKGAHASQGLLSSEGGASRKGSFRLALIPRGVEPKGIPSNYTTQLEVPIQAALPMSTEYLASFVELDALDKVCAITSARSLKDSSVLARVADGSIRKIGYEGSFDTEAIMAAQPDVVLVSPFKRGGYDQLTTLDIPLVPHLGFKEQTPLGQAEWIKFVAMLTGKEVEANRYFRQVADEYNRLKALAEHTTERPTLFSGEQKTGEWFMMGGRSYLAQLVRDAGARYLPADDPHTGGYSSDFETAFSMAAHADYWRVLNGYKGRFSYDALAAEDERHTRFDAFKKRHVIYCNMGSSRYHELAPLHPHWMLADLIAVLHPTLLPDHSAHFYKLLSD